MRVQRTTSLPSTYRMHLRKTFVWTFHAMIPNSSSSSSHDADGEYCHVGHCRPLVRAPYGTIMRLAITRVLDTALFSACIILSLQRIVCSYMQNLSRQLRGHINQCVCAAGSFECIWLEQTYIMIHIFITIDLIHVSHCWPKRVGQLVCRPDDRHRWKEVVNT